MIGIPYTFKFLSLYRQNKKFYNLYVRSCTNFHSGPPRPRTSTHFFFLHLTRRRVVSFLLRPVCLKIKKNKTKNWTPGGARMTICATTVASNLRMWLALYSPYYYRSNISLSVLFSFLFFSSLLLSYLLFSRMTICTTTHAT